MLNYTRRYIRLLAFFITIFVFIVLIVIDISKLQIHQKNLINQTNIETENSIAIENVYTELSKKFQDNASKDEQEDKQEIEKLTNVDIYSTNPWRIKIPSIRLDAPITEGTSSEALRRTVGHFEQTDKWEGNVCLAGHNRGYRCNFFQDIKELKKGDIILYSTEKGERKYQVVLNTVIKETDWSYIQNTKDNRITLITCETNRKEYRRCIQAVEV